jgi:hypothetical protein
MRIKRWTDIYGVTRLTPIPPSWPPEPGEETVDSVKDHEWKGVLSGDGGTCTLSPSSNKSENKTGVEADVKAQGDVSTNE